MRRCARRARSSPCPAPRATSSCSSATAWASRRSPPRASSTASARASSGEENRLSFETFPATALSRTYETDFQTPESAGTMTAIMSGVKTRAGVIGVDQIAKRGDCTAGHGNETVSALELAELAGQSTGVVTTTRITHATPAATYAHTADRDWEADAEIPEAARAAGFPDIARQLVEFPLGDGIDVALGGGRAEFMPAEQRDPEYPRCPARGSTAAISSRSGASAAALGLCLEPRAARSDRSRRRRRICSASSSPRTCSTKPIARETPAGEPSLSRDDGARRSSMLQEDAEGLFPDGRGRPHRSRPSRRQRYRALTETIEFANAVRVAPSMTEPTRHADPRHRGPQPHAYVSPATRSAAIRSSARWCAPATKPERASPLAICSGCPTRRSAISNGPGYTGASPEQAEGPKHFPHRPTGYRAATGRPDLTNVDTTAPSYLQEASVPLRARRIRGRTFPCMRRVRAPTCSAACASRTISTTRWSRRSAGTRRRRSRRRRTEP